jgi:hypothetical protein
MNDTGERDTNWTVILNAPASASVNAHNKLVVLHEKSTTQKLPSNCPESGSMKKQESMYDAHYELLLKSGCYIMPELNNRVR